MGKYKCPVCGCVAEINQAAKVVSIHLPPDALTFPQVGHPCELAKAVDQIDLTKLEKLE